MEHTAKTFPCPPCAEEGKRLVQFDRDFVELKIGKKPQDPGNFLKVLEEAQKLAEKRGIMTRSRIREVLGPFADLPGHEIKGGVLHLGPIAGNPHNPRKKSDKEIEEELVELYRARAKASGTRFSEEAVRKIIRGDNPGKRFGKPFGLTECEKKHPEIVAKLERCSKEVAKDPSITSPVAVCRASIPCP